MTKVRITLNQNDCHAEAEYDPDTKVTTILIGAKWAEEKVSLNGRRAQTLRQQCRTQGIVNSNGEFVKDYPIEPERAGSTSLSPAAEVIVGRPSQGTADWKVLGDHGEEEIKIKDYLEKEGIWESTERINSPRECNDNSEKLVEDTPQENKENLNEKISKEIEEKGYLRQNVVFYGVPGCGKSYRINKLLHLDDKGNSLDTKYYKRILFHPEYLYSDFVGQLRPVTKGKNITYQFAPGPFTEILCDAYKDREHEYFLIIEEINRGNAPAIFGDLFQLLDRKDSGVSEYSIDNKDILDYFKRESKKDDTGAMAQVVETIEDGIRIPKNLTIFATMNTCDQNVFTLDTAFKRRWRMSRIVNDFDKDSSISEWKISFKSDGFLWKEFAKAVNDAILNNCNDGTAAEDKQLGTHFIKECDLTPARRFAEKVLLYLWDDVAKYDKSQLFDTNKYKTLDMVIDGFAEGENVFSPNCAKLQELYNNMKQPGQTDENAAGVPSGAAPGTDSSVKNAATDEEQGGE